MGRKGGKEGVKGKWEAKVGMEGMRKVKAIGKGGGGESWEGKGTRKVRKECVRKCRKENKELNTGRGNRKKMRF
jgi:hypothetical protein